MYDFADLDETETVLQKMIDRAGRSAGAETAACARNEGAAICADAGRTGGVGRSDHIRPDRIEFRALEAEVGRLRDEVAELRRRLDEVLN